MNSNIWTSIALLVLILLDATGDALRAQGRQIWSHLIEVLQIALWFAIWASMYFMTGWIIVYISCRLWLFDIVYNLCAGNRILYIGQSDMMGRVVRWFTGVVDQRYEHFSFMIKVMAFVLWIGWNIKILT